MTVFANSARLHHKSSSDGVQWVRGNSGNGGNVHSVQELDNNAGVLLILKKNHFSGIVESEIKGSIGDNSDNGDSESLIKSEKSITLVNLAQTVDQTVELSGIFSDIGGQSGSGEIQRINEAQTGSAGGSS